MITTRQISVNLTKGRKLDRVTTREIDASIKITKLKNPVKPKSISTTTLPDVADIAEKKKRDKIMTEKKLAIKNEKNIVMIKQKKTGKKLKVIFEDSDSVYLGEKGKLIVKKNPWNKMNAEERKEYQRVKKEKK